MLASYEAAYTWFSAIPKEDSFWHTQILGGYFPRPLVFASTIFSALCRSVVESPFEYAKVI